MFEVWRRSTIRWLRLAVLGDHRSDSLDHLLKAALAPGKFVRFRSPQDVVKELTTIDEMYEDVGTVYLEVETFSANQRYAYALTINGRGYDLLVNAGFTQSMLAATAHLYFDLRNAPRAVTSMMWFLLRQPRLLLGAAKRALALVRRARLLVNKPSTR